ncbi:MAG: hypothetical protein E7137_08140 [Rikenellaceae bacterium]|nr:hypothetical protein [Rikenellaceae bacterium]
MKNFLFSALALAGFAACSTDSELNETIAPEQKETFTLSASIVTPDESRVSIGGEKYTEVSWDADDFISIRSAAGVGENGAAVLQTEEGGRSDVRFTGDLAPKQDYDTYYAVYPRRDFSSTTVSVDYTTQDGTAKNAALLVGVAENAYKYDVNMTFSPVNSLIHVSLTDAPEALKSVVLQQKGATKGFMTKYNYDVATGSASSSGDSVITINNPAADFFIALPGGLALADGYELVFTTTGDKTFARSYKGKTFEMGTTTRISVKWEEPSVTLRAMTSYSYYANGNATMANQCDNSTIYFNLGPDNADNCRSSYAGIQDSMITDCGFIVGGTTYNTSNGVTWDKENNQFYMNNMGSQAWQAHTVQAFIVTKHNGTITSSDDLHVTGLPYKANPPQSLSADPINGWHTGSGNAHNFENSYLQLGVSGGKQEHTVYKDFHIPSTVNVVVSSKFDAYNAPINTTSSILIGSGTIASINSGGSLIKYKTSTYEDSINSEMSSSASRVTLKGSYCVTNSRSRFYYVNINYR